jgi:hypothetical protein
MIIKLPWFYQKFILFIAVCYVKNPESVNQVQLLLTMFGHFCIFANMKDKSLLLILLFPILFFGLLLGSIFLPRLWINPKYGFLYSSLSGCSYENLTTATNPNNSFEINKPSDAVTCSTSDSGGYHDLYYYDIGAKKANKITLAEAKKLQINNDKTSPDGYKFNHNYSNGALFGSGSPNYNPALEGKGGTYPLNIESKYSGQWTFYGWVIK